MAGPQPWPLGAPTALGTAGPREDMGRPTLTSHVITSSDRLPPPPLTSEGGTSGAEGERDGVRACEKTPSGLFLVFEAISSPAHFTRTCESIAHVCAHS